MIYVLALSAQQAESWRRHAGLAPRNVTILLNEMAVRGRSLANADCVMLPGFEQRPDITRFRLALAPTQVELAHVHRVPEWQ